MSLHEKAWERAQNLGLTSNIKTKNDYSLAEERGIERASKLFNSSDIIIPNNQEIKNIHKACFMEIHPWAGKFREPGQEVRVGDIRGSLAIDVPEELKRLHKQMTAKLLDRSDPSKEYKAKQIASYHAIYCLLYTSPSPRDRQKSRMPSSA